MKHDQNTNMLIEDWKKRLAFASDEGGGNDGSGAIVFAPQASGSTITGAKQTVKVTVVPED